jgi:integrase
MPKMKVDEEADIVIFTKEQLQQLDDYFKGSNAETAYLLGKYCGLRINECYGLKWDHVNLDKGTVLIDRQMQYQNGLIKLVSVKTKNARREVYLSSEARSYLDSLRAGRDQKRKELAQIQQQNQTFIQDIDGHTISSLELVNCLPDGKIQTNNSMKYHAKMIKSKYGFTFKYHYLRHTYGTALAERNTPAHILCNQMGHGKIGTTQQYYLAVSQEGIDRLKENLDTL